MLIPIAAGATIAVEVMLLGREHYLHAFVPVLVAGGAAAVLTALAARRAAGPAIAALLALCLIAPAAYASTLWQVPTDGTFPAAGPHAAYGYGGIGANPVDLVADRRLIAYVDAHGPGSRWTVLAEASGTAAPFILMNVAATALAGYSGTDPGTRRARARPLGRRRPGALRAARRRLRVARWQRGHAGDAIRLPARALDGVARHPRERAGLAAALRLPRPRPELAQAG